MYEYTLYLWPKTNEMHSMKGTANNAKLLMQLMILFTTQSEILTQSTVAQTGMDHIMGSLNLVRGCNLLTSDHSTACHGRVISLLLYIASYTQLV